MKQGSTTSKRKPAKKTSGNVARKPAAAAKPAATKKGATTLPAARTRPVIEARVVRMPVICISRSLASGGEEVGRMVAERLRYRFADEEIIVRAAERAGVSPEAVAAAEHPPGLITRILTAMALAQVDTAANGQFLMPPVRPGALGYEEIIESVIRETANEGSVVIVAHGASVCLKGQPGVLRVLVTASPEVRADRVARERGVGPRQAEKAVQESDKQRQEFLGRFYNVRAEQPTHYDLVASTDTLSTSKVASLVVSAAGG